MGYGMECFLHGRKIARERCMAKNIIGAWSCLNCKCMNFWGEDVCKNCAYEWETPNKRLYGDDEADELQPGSDDYWATFLTKDNNPFGLPYATQGQIDLFCRKQIPQDDRKSA